MRASWSNLDALRGVRQADGITLHEPRHPDVFPNDEEMIWMSHMRLRGGYLPVIEMTWELGEWGVTKNIPIPQNMSIQIDLQDHIEARSGDEQNLLIKRKNVMQIVKPGMRKMMKHFEIRDSINQYFRLGTDIKLVFGPTCRLEDERGVGVRAEMPR